MKILVDREIIQRQIIINGVDTKVSYTDDGQEKIASFGLEPLGYTFRCAIKGALVYSFKEQAYIPIENRVTVSSSGRKSFWLYSGENVKMFTMEELNMPSNVTILNFTGKSTYICREGCILHATQVEPGYRGVLAFGMTNLAGPPVRVYLEEGIMQANFIEVDETPSTAYQGHYQGEKGTEFTSVVT